MCAAVVDQKVNDYGMTKRQKDGKTELHFMVGHKKINEWDQWGWGYFYFIKDARFFFKF